MTGNHGSGSDARTPRPRTAPWAVRTVRVLDLVAAALYLIAAFVLAEAGGSLQWIVPAAAAMLYVLLGFAVLRGSYLVGLLQIVVSAMQVMIAFVCILAGGGAQMFGVVYAVFHVPLLVLMLGEPARQYFMAARERRADRTLVDTFE